MYTLYIGLLGFNPDRWPYMRLLRHINSGCYQPDVGLLEAAALAHHLAGLIGLPFLRISK